MQNTYREADAQDALKQGEDRVKQTIADVEKRVKQGKEQLEKVVANVDKRLHENPWPIVGGVAVSCLLLGFILGISKRH